MMNKNQFDLNAILYQHSFKRLSNTTDVRHLSEIFGMILLENFDFSHIAISFKSDDESTWELLFTTDESLEDFCQFCAGTNRFCMQLIEHPRLLGCINLPLIDHSRFGIVLGALKNSQKFAAQHEATLHIFLQQLDSAYQVLLFKHKERDFMFSQNHRIVQLTGLFDSSVEISRLKESSDILQTALQKVLALTNASKGALTIQKDDNPPERYFYPQAFEADAMQNDGYVISANFVLNKDEYDFFLYQKESRAGVVPFDATDRLLLQAFCRQVQVSLENQFFYEQSLEKERLDHEIYLAGEIQKRIIPETLPIINGFDLHAVNVPAKFIGGDFYDCIPLKDGRFFFVIADVAGKGVAAALLVNTLHAALHAHLESFKNLTAIVRQLNRIIFESATTEKYLTAVFACLDVSTKTLSWVNAGHNPPYIQNANGTILELNASCLPLGFLPELPECLQLHTTLQVGDGLLFYTDGISEAMNKKGEEYEARHPLKAFMKQRKNLPAEVFLSSLLEEIKDFTDGAQQSDDITALYLKAGHNTNEKSACQLKDF
ncbi:PP2C family protein-serine/threonine phosphatase [Calditrichota bacterium GD2]